MIIIIIIFISIISSSSSNDIPYIINTNVSYIIIIIATLVTHKLLRIS